MLCCARAKMTIRHYTTKDFPAICSIYADAKRDELQFEGHSFDVTPLARDDAILAAFNESVVTVFDDGVEVLGFAAAFEGQLRALFVGRNARGRGVGQALLDAVLANETGGVSLNVAKSNVDAIRFYRRNGFVVVDEALKRYAGFEVTYVGMFCPHRIGA